MITLDGKYIITYCQQESNFNYKVIDRFKGRGWIQCSIYHAYNYQRKLQWLCYYLKKQISEQGILQGIKRAIS